MQTNSKYYDSGDKLEYTIDSLRNKTTYGYNGDDLKVASVTQNGKTINYEYEENTSLVNRVWSQFTNIDGTSQRAENIYEYENDRIKSITHNGPAYKFSYDNFGNMRTVHVGTKLLMTNQYGANNGLLIKSTYGNGHYVENEYDYYDRITGIKYNGTKLFSYVYNSEGLISRHIDNVNNKTYNYEYDMLGRLQRMDVTGGDSILYKYNNLNQVTGTTYNFNNTTKSSTYTYKKGGIPDQTTYPNGATKTHGLNGQAQLDETVLTTTGTNPNQWKETCIYYTPANTGSTSYTTNLVGKYTFEALGREISYTYDGSGNIKTKADTKYSTTDKIEYFYDELNQLIRENDPVANKTTTYLYDVGGNILEKREYDYTTSDTLGTAKKTTKFSYANGQWKDLLTSYTGHEILYDPVGNPLKFGNITMTWERGRKLSTMTFADGTTASFKYNADGIRTQKTVDGVTTDYFLEGSTIVAQKTGDDVIWYYFDGDGTRDAIEYNGNVYYYMYNPQGDVIGLFDNDLNVVVEYTYDSWGKVKTTGTLKDTLGKANPFRYRGYYYDEETGLYYVSSRYYDPEIGRWINADNVIAGVGGDLKGYNLFAYCFNNPVNMDDQAGNWPKWIKNTVKWVAKNIVKPVVKTVQKTLSKVDLTYSTGVNVSGTPSAWIFNGQIGVSMDTKGNVAIQASGGGGITGGDPGISITRYQSVTNAPNIDKLNDAYYQVGGSIAVPIEGVPVAAGGDVMFMPDPALNTGYFGLTGNVGFGTPGKEFHVEWGTTVTLPYTQFNVYEVARSVYIKIMEW